ncbi:YdgA family protein [Rosenbergiella australiborealis]|uniref:YdgA family protein n=1 Tax=Rosenbergiella australiborealis TaxID=1544696 RepID=UPI001F4E4E99|nr:YdgA family protein [Rosenbergiella australiborealis]
MKKSKVTIAVIVGIGVLWTAGAWFTGKKTEQHIDDIVAQLNEQLTKNFPEAGLFVTRQGYQRHLFSSNTQFVVKSRLPASDANALLAPGDELVFNEKISHGPFPLAQLKHFNLVPALASIHSELANTPTVKSLFDFTKGKTPLSAETRVGYNQSTSSSIRIEPLNYQTEDSRLSSDPITIALTTAVENKAFVLKVNAGKLTLGFDNEANTETEITLNNLSLDSDSKLSSEGLRIGTQHIAADNFVYAVNHKPSLQLVGVKGSSNLDSHNNLLNGELNYQIDKIEWQQLPLGSTTLKLSLSDFSASGMKTFYDQYNLAVQKNMANIAHVTTQDQLQAMQNEVNTTVLQNIPALLAGSPHFSIDNFSLKNDKGESHFSMKVDFNDPAKAQITDQGLSAIVDTYIKQLSASLSVNKPMATQLLSVIAQSQGAAVEQSDQFAAQQINALSTLGESYHLATTNADDISTALQYSAGQVTVNDDKMTLEKFIEQYLTTDSSQ